MKTQQLPSSNHHWSMPKDSQRCVFVPIQSPKEPKETPKSKSLSKKKKLSKALGWPPRKEPPQPSVVPQAAAVEAERR